MADAYTSAEVLGVDLAPIQPQWYIYIRALHGFANGAQGSFQLPLRD